MKKTEKSNNRICFAINCKTHEAFWRRLRHCDTELSVFFAQLLPGLNDKNAIFWLTGYFEDPDSPWSRPCDSTQLHIPSRIIDDYSFVLFSHKSVSHFPDISHVKAGLSYIYPLSDSAIQNCNNERCLFHRAARFSRDGTECQWIT